MVVLCGGEVCVWELLVFWLFGLWKGIVEFRGLFFFLDGVYVVFVDEDGIEICEVMIL